MAENLAIGGRVAPYNLNEDQRTALSDAVSCIDLVNEANGLAALLRTIWVAQASGELASTDLETALLASQSMAEQISTAAYLKIEADFVLASLAADEDAPESREDEQ